MTGPTMTDPTMTDHPRFGAGYDLDDFEDAAQAPCYGSVDAFVREYLRHMYKRRIDGRTRVWAARWWSYGEAISRLDALWRSWESLRQDPSTGMSVWWRDHADYHMPVLLDPDGVFFDSADDPANTNRRGDPLPYEPPPDGMFPDLR
ncbi:hypothetical protein GCM10011575_28930 [Microlunatus endophyticus]|uniref:DUF4913 domain-containing protein n=1 Tax=Microlunatus endophyticus TaxID=1716077 RepID=A0A917W670_9ACTN|nr:DUF4913 domain-containing protein [Microlunatus endophyticus]GGL68534.1 hypothetical protein GCM10011575_28930 [Microlunatus endophyticus]